MRSDWGGGVLSALLPLGWLAIIPLQAMLVDRHCWFPSGQIVLVVLAWQFPSTDKSLSGSTPLAKWPWLPQNYSCKVLFLLLYFPSLASQKLARWQKLHVGHFIPLLNQTSNSTEHAVRNTNAGSINWALCYSIWMIRKTAYLVNTAEPWPATIKHHYDKALAYQIRRDL